MPGHSASDALTGQPRPAQPGQPTGGRGEGLFTRREGFQKYLSGLQPSQILLHRCCEHQM